MKKTYLFIGCIVVIAVATTYFAWNHRTSPVELDLDTTTSASHETLNPDADTTPVTSTVVATSTASTSTDSVTLKN